MDDMVAALVGAAGGRRVNVLRLGRILEDVCGVKPLDRDALWESACHGKKYAWTTSMPSSSSAAATITTYHKTIADVVRAIAATGRDDDMIRTAYDCLMISSSLSDDAVVAAAAVPTKKKRCLSWCGRRLLFLQQECG